MGDIVQSAHRQNKSVGLCGEMAGDLASALLLLGLGRFAEHHPIQSVARQMDHPARQIDHPKPYHAEGTHARKLTFQNMETAMHVTKHKMSILAAQKAGAG